MTEDKDISEHGLKVRAGQALTRHLIQVGQEKTESNGFDDKGSSRQITKIEALARLMWKLAFGYEEEIRSLNKDGKATMTKKIVAPDKALIALIYDRLEGKVSSGDDEGAKKQPGSNKVQDQVQRRMTQMSKTVTDEEN